MDFLFSRGEASMILEIPEDAAAGLTNGGTLPEGFRLA